MKHKIHIGWLIALFITISEGYVCNRTPPKSENPKPNLDRYIVEVSGNPSKYTAEQTYIITLKTSPSNPITNTFTKFMLVVEPKNPLEALQNSPTGDLSPVDYSIARFTPKCPNAVIQTNSLSKSSVEIKWTAPPTGNGCIDIKATVYESSDSWFTDDGGLTKELCEEEENKDVQPQVLEKCCACDEAKYEVAFQGLWTRNTHPKDYPQNMWTTKLGEIIGASHRHSKSFWNYNDLASDGLKLLAEKGDTTILENELKELVNSDDIRTIIKARELSYPNITGVSYTVFRVDQEHHLISLVSKITPSPDWIVGISNLELCTLDCKWVPSRTLNLYPWDVGTDDGPSYNSPDLPSESPQPVKVIASNLKEYPFYNEDGEPVKPIAQLKVTRQKLYEKACDENVDLEEDKCKLTEWSQWSSCSSTCGSEVMTRDRELLHPESVEDCNKEVPLQLQETVSCKIEDSNCEPSECNNAVWSDWSPCNTTCGVGTKTRTSNRTQDTFDQIECEETVECYMPECEMETTTETETVTYPSLRVVTEGPSYSSVVDCEVSEWSDWGTCSATEPCTKGRQYRERHIVVHPQNGGKACPKLRDPKRCRVPCERNNHKTKKLSNAVDCQMGSWSRWSPCSSNCGSSAVQKRTRVILDYPRNGGRMCGPRIEERKCSLPYACSDRESFYLNKYY